MREKSEVLPEKNVCLLLCKNTIGKEKEGSGVGEKMFELMGCR